MCEKKFEIERILHYQTFISEICISQKCILLSQFFIIIMFVIRSEENLRNKSINSLFLSMCTFYEMFFFVIIIHNNS